MKPRPRDVSSTYRNTERSWTEPLSQGRKSTDANNSGAGGGGGAAKPVPYHGMAHSKDEPIRPQVLQGIKTHQGQLEVIHSIANAC